MLKKIILLIFISLNILLAKENIKVLYLPLADHYSAIVAHAKYRDKMKDANFELIMMKSMQSLRGKFEAKQADMALIISPMAMDMFSINPNFRFVSLVHRDGNALAINEVFNRYAILEEKIVDRKPDSKVANAISKIKKETNSEVIVAIPSLLATHTVVLYKYLRDNNKSLIFDKNKDGDVLAKVVYPPHATKFLERQTKLNKPASFEQSLPWADIVESDGYGKVAWYSKDVMKWPKGHVECIVIAHDEVISKKEKALKEVIYYIHKAGREIDLAKKNLSELKKLAKIIHSYIPIHSIDAIMHSLRSDLNVINYSNLNIDKEGLKYIMDLALEAKLLKESIDIDKFSDESFSTQITKEK